MKWNIAGAKKGFSKMIHKTKDGTQIIYNRNKLVAAVINAEEYRDYKKYLENNKNDNLGTRFKELQNICFEEDYDIIVPKRQNRDIKWR